MAGAVMPQALVETGEAALRSFSQVIFSRSRLVGLLLLLATLTEPVVGLAGLLGACLTGCIGLALGFDRDAFSAGMLSYSGLLTGAVLGAWLEPSWVLLVAAPVVALLVVVLHVALEGGLRYHLRLPVLSLPFVLGTWLTLAALTRVPGVQFRAAPLQAPWPWPGPPELERLLESLGAIFALPTWTAGLMVLAALVLWSRIGTVYALVGYGVARLLEVVLLGPDALYPADLGFNAVLVAVALGGVFHVPGRAAMALAAAGAAAGSLVAAGVAALGWPVLALPFNLVVLGTVYALKQRARDASPRSVHLPGASPEESLHRFQTRDARFHRDLPVALQLPFRGAWTCTQGNDGEPTHQGPWRHGLDFEVVGPDGERHDGDGTQVADWHAYGRPVCAMAPGTVVEIVDGLPDNPVGQVDTEHRWGNLVVVEHAPALFGVVCHLRAGSIQVRVGDAVRTGQVLGRCGSSGRSPVPHLHVQLQATSLVGDRTVAIAFHGVVVEGGVRELFLEHLPSEGELVANLARAQVLGDALALPPGTRMELEVAVGDQVTREVVVSEVELVGGRCLRSEHSGAQLWFESRGQAFVVYDHLGPRDGALFVLYCALARLPLDGAELTWEDHLDPRRLRASPLTWLADALSAWRPPRVVRVVYESTHTADAWVVRGEGDALQTEVEVGPEGLRRAWIRLDERELEVRCCR